MLLDRPIPKALFYSHVRLEAKRNALDALSVPTELLQAAAQDPLRKEGGYDTNNDTNRNERETAPSELPENNGRPEWTRTIDLFRVKVRLTRRKNARRVDLHYSTQHLRPPESRPSLVLLHALDAQLCGRVLPDQ